MALVTMFVSVASAQDAKTVIANASKAMGYEGLNTIQYSGPLSHEGAGLGQWISPTKGWHNNTVRDFTRFIDLGAGTSLRNGTSKREGDAATGLLPGGGGLDPHWSKFLGSSIDASWDKTLHSRKGNLVLADGSVQQTKAEQLRAQIATALASGLTNVVFSKPRGIF
jgi:prepilin-type processing-associated H-X9-DG protein